MVTNHQSLKFLSIKMLSRYLWDCRHILLSRYFWPTWWISGWSRPKDRRLRFHTDVYAQPVPVITKQVLSKDPKRRQRVGAYLSVVLHDPQQVNAMHNWSLMELSSHTQELLQLFLAQVLQHPRVHQVCCKIIRVLKRNNSEHLVHQNQFDGYNLRKS